MRENVIAVFLANLQGLEDLTNVLACDLKAPARIRHDLGPGQACLRVWFADDAYQ